RTYLGKTALHGAAIGVIVGVNGAHGPVFHGDEAVLEVPGVGKAVDHGHVAVGVIGVNTGGVGYARECVWSGSVAGIATDSTDTTADSARTHGTKVGHGEAFLEMRHVGVLRE